MKKKIFFLSAAVGILLSSSVQAFAVNPPVSNPPPESVLVIGDSISTGYGLSSPNSQSYAALFADEFSLSGSKYKNIAENGATSEDISSSLDGQSGILADYDVFLVTAGGNDLLKPFLQVITDVLGADFSAGTDFETILEEKFGSDPQAAFQAIADEIQENQADLMVQALNPQTYVPKIAETIRSSNPDARIYIQTVYNPFSGAEGLGEFSDLADMLISMINSGIKSKAQESGYTVIDTFSEFSGKADTLTNIGKLDIHPNIEGHKKIDELIIEQFDVSYESTQEGGSVTEENPTTGGEERKSVYIIAFLTAVPACCAISQKVSKGKNRGI